MIIKRRINQSNMASYKQLDNYINDLEEENVVYVEKKLDYAEKCHKLEERIGCPLEVYIKATLGRFWVEDEQKWHSLQDSLIIKTSNGEYAWCIGHDMSDYRLILLSEYKTTWWLKEDCSE